MSVPTIRSFLESVLLERDCTPSHAASLRYRVDVYGVHLGRLATLEDLAPDAVNSWVKSLQECGKYQPRTVKHFRDAILFLWRNAFERGDVEVPPYRVRQIKIPQEIVRAWTIDELRQLVASVVILRGCVPETAIRRVDWFRAYIYTAYCTGLRRCDLMHWARWEDVSNEILTVVQKKTGYVVSRRLTRQSLEALELLPGRDFILPWPGDRRRFYESFHRLVRSAGIRPGGPKLLRRTAGSIVERDRPGSGGMFLGHRDPAMFDRHYHDRSLSSQVPEPPPEI